MTTRIIILALLTALILDPAPTDARAKRVKPRANAKGRMDTHGLGQPDAATPPGHATPQPERYEAAPTDAFGRALSMAKGPAALQQALQILREARGRVDPDTKISFRQHTTVALVHATRVHLYLASDDVHPAKAGTNLSLSLIRELLQQGADPDAKDFACQSPLSYAVHGKSLRLTKLLLDHGARSLLAIPDPEPFLRVWNRITTCMGLPYEAAPRVGSHSCPILA
jgi:hypothetical protein